MSGLQITARRWTGRAGTIAFVLAALALARTVGDQLPRPVAVYAAPHAVQGTLGKPTDLRTVRVVTNNPQVSDRMRVFLSSDTYYETPGVFVMVDVAYKPVLQDTGLGYVEVLAADGTSYRPGRSGMSTCTFAHVDTKATCSVTVEMDPADVPGAVLRLATDIDDPRFDSLLEVPLDLTAADVRAGVDAGKPVVEINEREATP